LDYVRESQPWLPVIVITQFNEIEIIRKAIGSQIQGLLIKDIHLNTAEELLKDVNKYLVPSYRNIMAMGREQFITYLETVDEKTFTLKILVPLFYKLGYRGIRYVHGPREDGLDLIFYDTDRLGIRRYIGIQVKAVTINRATGQSNYSIINILQQIQIAFGLSFYILSEKKNVRLEHMYVITSKSFTKDAQEYIRKSLVGHIPSQHIDFWDNNDILDQLNTLKNNEKLHC
jgi:hypothetical protein